MTVEDLRMIAIELYREAEEDAPILGGTGKKEWISNKLEEMIEDDDPRVKDLLRLDTTAEIEDYMENMYELKDVSYRNPEEEERDAFTEWDDMMYRNPAFMDGDQLVVDPVGDVLGVSEYEYTEKPIEGEKNAVLDYKKEVREPKNAVDDHKTRVEDKQKVVTTCSNRNEKNAGGMDPNKDWLEDDYINERPQQPEYLSDDPSHFDPDLINRNSSSLINDGVDDRMREAIDSEDDNFICRGQ